MARPTKYSKAVLEQARDYLENYEEYGDAIPSIAGLACHLKVSRSRVYEWGGSKYPEFQDILDDILSKQESRLVNKGLMGEYNPTITKLILGKHGYSEKSDQTLSGPNGGPIEVAERPQMSKEEWLKAHGVGASEGTTD